MVSRMMLNTIQHTQIAPEVRSMAACMPFYFLDLVEMYVWYMYIRVGHSPYVMMQTVTQNSAYFVGS